MFPEFPARSLTLTVPLAVYEGLAVLADDVETVEEVVARLLGEAVAYGSPADLRVKLNLSY